MAATAQKSAILDGGKQKRQITTELIYAFLFCKPYAAIIVLHFLYILQLVFALDDLLREFLSDCRASLSKLVAPTVHNLE